MSKKNEQTLDKSFPYILIVCGGVGLLASLALTLDKMKLLADPNAVLNCNINPIISCGSAISTPQGEAFGMPNVVWGIAAFAGVVTIGMALLAGAKFKKWFWLGLQLGTIFGLLFCHWLIYEAVFKIGKVCPWCMVTWVVMIAMFLYTTLLNLREGRLKTPATLKGVVSFAQKQHGSILTVWYLAIAGLILYKFWHYWQTLI